MHKKVCQVFCFTINTYMDRLAFSEYMEIFRVLGVLFLGGVGGGGEGRSRLQGMC